MSALDSQLMRFINTRSVASHVESKFSRASGQAAQICETHKRQAEMQFLDDLRTGQGTVWTRTRSLGVMLIADGGRALSEAAGKPAALRPVLFSKAPASRLRPASHYFVAACSAGALSLVAAPVLPLAIAGLLGPQLVRGLSQAVIYTLGTGTHHPGIDYLLARSPASSAPPVSPWQTSGLLGLTLVAVPMAAAVLAEQAGRPAWVVTVCLVGASLGHLTMQTLRCIGTLIRLALAITAVGLSLPAVAASTLINAGQGCYMNAKVTLLCSPIDSYTWLPNRFSAGRSAVA